MAIITETPSVYRLELDPTVPLDEWIRRGNYGQVDSQLITENFKLTLSGRREIVFYELTRHCLAGEPVERPEEIIAWMKRDGYVPATLDDALAFGAEYPECQTRHDLVFLGTSVPGRGEAKGFELFPILRLCLGERALGFEGMLIAWFAPPQFRFAAVRMP